MDSRERRGLLIIALLTMLCSSASSQSHLFTERESGWTTGLRQSSNISLDISGSAIGEGRYQRYTEMGLLEVRMRERIAAANGTLDTGENIRLVADITNDFESAYSKLIDGQDWVFTATESWPVAMSAQRNIDYLGKGISDREILGNNLDYVGASYLRAKDLKKERSSQLVLQNAWWEALINDTTDIIVRDIFQPNKSIDYYLNSRSQGQVSLKYRQARDRITAKESVEDYAGYFEIARHIQMVNYRVNETYETDEMQCCTNVPLAERVFATRSDDY